MDNHRFFYVNDGKDMHKYFKKFEEILKSTKHRWSHIDLLFVRCTEQNYVKNLLFIDDKATNDFFMQQLEISRRMLEMICPKIIVVNNTLARTLMVLKKRMDVFSVRI